MTLFLAPSRLAAYLFDIILTLLFYRKMPNRSTQWYRWLLSCLPLLFFYPLMVQPTPIESNLIRFLWRWVCIFVFLVVQKVGPWTEKLYDSLLCATAFGAIQNFIIITEFWITQSTWSVGFQFVFRGLVSYVIPFVIFCLMSWLIPFHEPKYFSRKNSLVLIAVTVAVLYVKQSFFNSSQEGTSTSIAFTVYPLIISVLSCSIIAYIDRYHFLQENKQQQEVIQVISEYRYQNLQNQLFAQEEILRIQHDIKNHLLTLEGLSDAERSSYLNTLLSKMSSSRLIHTGDPTLDGLINTKLNKARDSKIDITVSLNLSQLGFMDPVDKCAIFGNIIDNAIEAAELVMPPDARFITLKSSEFGGQLLVTISNSYNGQSGYGKALPLKTHKSDKKHHGIGMKSIQNSLERYHGILVYEAEKDRFLVKLMIPIMQSGNTEHAPHING